MKSKNVFLFGLVVTTLISISCRKERDMSEFLLLSDSEAPLGWMYFTIYNDSTFEYTSRGLSDKNVFIGKATITKDTIYLKYKDSIPNIGTKVFYTKAYVEFVEVNNARFYTRLNKLK